jgi:hypothetical protein
MHECQVAAAKGLSIVLSAAEQENGFPDFSSTGAKNALEQESAFVLSAAGQASLRLRHTTKLTHNPPQTRRRVTEKASPLSAG